MGAWFCKRCGQLMRGWFDHVRPTKCDCQHAEWAEEE